MKNLVNVAPQEDERSAIFYGRYTKGIPFLTKKKRIRVWTSGRCLPLQNFVECPLPGLEDLKQYLQCTAGLQKDIHCQVDLSTLSVMLYHHNQHIHANKRHDRGLEL